MKVLFIVIFFSIVLFGSEKLYALSLPKPLKGMSKPFAKVKRLWECRNEKAAKKNNCSQWEKAVSKKWIIRSSVAAIATALATGAIVGGAYLATAHQETQPEQFSMPIERIEDPLSDYTASSEAIAAHRASLILQAEAIAAKLPVLREYVADTEALIQQFQMTGQQSDIEELQAGLAMLQKEYEFYATELVRVKELIATTE